MRALLSAAALMSAVVLVFILMPQLVANAIRDISALLLIISISAAFICLILGVGLDMWRLWIAWRGRVQ